MNIQFTKSDFGVHATITGEWQDSFYDIFEKHNVKSLELNRAKGWVGKDINFLKDVEYLESFSILDFQIQSILPVHFLKRLKKIEVITYCKTALSFGAFPKLEHCAIKWRKGSESLFDCKQLKELFLDGYNQFDSDAFSALTNLEKLTIANSSIRNLDGLSKLTRLTYLRLGYLNNITSIEPINTLKRLQELEIQNCKKVASIKGVEYLSELKKILLIDMGSIDSLLPLRNIRDIQWILFYGTTNIIDGNISFLRELRKLSKISFQNRRHYTLKTTDFVQKT
jgi:hypothetical protein